MLVLRGLQATEAPWVLMGMGLVMAALRVPAGVLQSCAMRGFVRLLRWLNSFTPSPHDSAPCSQRSMLSQLSLMPWPDAQLDDGTWDMGQK